MKELEKLDLAEIRIDGQEECEYFARIALRDGTERDEAYMSCWSALRWGQDLANTPKVERARP